MADINREQYAILEKFFFECVRYWERSLNTDSDIDNRPYINALKDIPTTNPYVIQGEPIDEETRKYFIKCRYMDTYGKDWKHYYKES